MLSLLHVCCILISQPCTVAALLHIQCPAFTSRKGCAADLTRVLMWHLLGYTAFLAHDSSWISLQWDLPVNVTIHTSCTYVAGCNAAMQPAAPGSKPSNGKFITPEDETTDASVEDSPYQFSKAGRCHDCSLLLPTHAAAPAVTGNSGRCRSLLPPENVFACTFCPLQSCACKCLLSYMPAVELSLHLSCSSNCLVQAANIFAECSYLFHSPCLAGVSREACVVDGQRAQH